MKRNQIIFIAIGAVALVGALVVGYLLFDAFGANGDKGQDLEGSVSQVTGLVGAKIPPTKASVDAISKNTEDLEAWMAEATEAAAAGDLTVEQGLTPAVFKERLVNEAREFSKLPGTIDGALVKDGFAFGFSEYITGGQLPAADKLDKLQRQWADIRLVTETFAKCGVAAFLDVMITEKKEEKKPVVKPGARRGDRKGAKGKKQVAETPEREILSETYTLKFLAAPDAFVKVLNSFSLGSRFITVDSLSFARETDSVAQAVVGSAEKDKKQEASSRRRSNPRRRGGKQAEEEVAAEEEAAKKKGLAVDPAKEAPFTVTMTVSIFDFGTNPEPKAEEKAETEAKESETTESEPKASETKESETKEVQE